MFELISYGYQKNKFENMKILQNKICLNLNRLRFLSTKSTDKNTYKRKDWKLKSSKLNNNLSQVANIETKESRRRNSRNYSGDFQEKKFKNRQQRDFENSLNMGKSRKLQSKQLKLDGLGNLKHAQYLSNKRPSSTISPYTAHQPTKQVLAPRPLLYQRKTKSSSDLRSIQQSQIKKIQQGLLHAKKQDDLSSDTSQRNQIKINKAAKNAKTVPEDGNQRKWSNRFNTSLKNQQSLKTFSSNSQQLFLKNKYNLTKKQPVLLNRKNKWGRWKKKRNLAYFNSKKLKKLYLKYRKYLRRKRYKPYKKPNVGYLRLRRYLFARHRYLRKKSKYKRVRFKKNWLGYLIQKTQNRLWYPAKYKYAKGAVGRKILFNRHFKSSINKQKKAAITGKWWHKNKKPYWRRKRYRKFRFYENWVKGYYRLPATRKRAFQFIPTLYKKKYDNVIKKWIKEESWFSYFRRKKTRFWFRNKIFLRFMWQYRYLTRNHKRMDKFVRGFRRVSQPLKKFIRIELRLDRFILWWGLVNKIYGKHDKFARSIVEAGYIWVNFRPVYNYRYMVKKNDCVFFFNKWHHKIKILPFFYASQNYSVNFGTTKYLSGYSAFNVPLRRETIVKSLHKIKKNAWFFIKSKLTRRYPKNEWKRLKRQFSKNVKTLKGVKKLLSLKWLQRFVLKYHYYRNAPLTPEMQYYLTQAYYYFEKSYKYKLVVVLHAYTWAVFMMTCSSSQVLKITHQNMNMLINKRYW